MSPVIVRTLRVFAFAALIVLGLAIVAAAAIAWIGPESFPPVQVAIDDETFTLGELGWPQVFALAFGALLAVLVVCTVVPLALLIAFGAVALAFSLVLLPALAVVAALLSPLILIGWLIWRALRRPRATTIAA
jgi:hypothetical protein